MNVKYNNEEYRILDYWGINKKMKDIPTKHLCVEGINYILISEINNNLQNHEVQNQWR